MTKRIIALVLLVWAGAAMAVSCSDKGPEEKHSIIFAENPVMAGASAGDFEVAIVADAEWKASSADSWITLKTPTGGASCSFSVAANPETSSRDGKIRFSISGYSKDLTVRQVGNTGRLTLGQSSVDIDTYGTPVEVMVTSAENWTVSSVGASWLKAVPKNGATLTVSAGMNYSGKARTASVVLSTASDQASLSVTQAADNSVFFGASTEEGRVFAYKTGLVSTVTSDRTYTVTDGVDVLEISYVGQVNGSLAPTAVFLYTVDLDKVSLAVTCANDDDSSIKPDDTQLTVVQTIRQQLAAMQSKRGIQVWGGVNGDFFYGSSYGRNNLAQGIVVRRGVVLKDTFDGGTVCTVFALMKDGTGAILTQAEYAARKSSIAEALGGRQRLLQNGDIVSEDTTLEPRTAVGVSADKKTVYLLIVDGRRSNWSTGASYPMMSRMFLAMGASNAINLDGGGSSTFVVHEGTTAALSEFVTKNRPVDNTGDRAVINGIAIVKK